MSQVVKIAPVILNKDSQDCILDVIERSNKQTENSRKFKLACICNLNSCCDNFCILLILLFVLLISSIFAWLLGSLLYQLFHKEEDINIGLAILYGIISITSLYLIIYCLYKTCCPNWGQTKIKAIR